MPTRNALYDPNAAADHRRHAVERKRLGELLHSYFSPRSRRGKRKKLQVQAACEFHQRACLEADGRRHATVQELCAVAVRAMDGKREGSGGGFRGAGIGGGGRPAVPELAGGGPHVSHAGPAGGPAAWDDGV